MSNAYLTQNRVTPLTCTTTRRVLSGSIHTFWNPINICLGTDIDGVGGDESFGWTNTITTSELGREYSPLLCTDTVTSIDVSRSVVPAVRVLCDTVMSVYVNVEYPRPNPKGNRGLP